MAYVFVLPFVAVFLIFSVYPVLRTLQISFATYKGFGDMKFVGLKNYIRVLQDQYFWTALLNTIKIWSVNIVLQLGIAFLLTIAFSDIKFKLKGLGFFRAVYYLPNIIAATSVAFLFKTLLDWRYGTINQILAKLGVDSPINWLGQPVTAQLSISLIQTWKDYFEAASIDGAGRWKSFYYITLPLLRPILLYVTITSLIGGIQMFDLPFLIGTVTGEPLGSTQTAIMYLYKFGFASRPKQVGYASAIAYILFLMILIISLIQFKVMNRKED